MNKSEGYFESSQRGKQGKGREVISRGKPEQRAAGGEEGGDKL